MATRNHRDPHVANDAIAQALAAAGFTGVDASDELAPAPALELVATQKSPPEAKVRAVSHPAKKVGFTAKPAIDTRIEAPPVTAKPHQKAKAEARTQAPKAPAQHQKLKGDIPVWELFAPDQMVLFDRLNLGQGKGTFAFFFDEEGEVTSLALCVGFFNRAVLLKVVSGEGRLVERFPVGTAFSLDELRGLEIIRDATRQQMLNEFRRVMDTLRGQLYFALSRRVAIVARGR